MQERQVTHSEIDTSRRTATVSLLFCDLVASTERQHRLGDDAADEFRRAFFAALSTATTNTQGTIVKTMGDGMMVVFRDSAVDAVSCASRMHAEVEELRVEPPARVRVGVSAGEAAREHDDWFGTPVVEAARLCARADAGQTLVSEVVRALVGSRGGHHFRSLGTVALKGMPEPVAVATVIREPDAPARRRRQPPRRRWKWPVALAIATITFGGLATVIARSRSAAPAAAADYTPTLEAAPCSAAVRAVASDASCGFLAVPENRAAPQGRWIRVAYTRYPARHTPPAGAAPVIELASALDNAETVDDPVQSPVRDNTDLVVFGGRGLGSSTPALTCPEFSALGPEILQHSPTDSATIAHGQAALRTCHDRFVRQGVALDHYTTVDEADDVVDLMQALNVPRANLQAIWDGTRVALEVARKAPGAVRSMMLVDPETPRSSFMTNPPQALGAAFDRYVALCNGDRSCHAAYPDLARAFRADVAEQNAHPQTAVPMDLISGVLQVTDSHPSVFLDGNRVAQGLAATLTSSLRNMPLVAAGIEHPNTTLSASLAFAQNFPLVVKDFPWGGFLSRMCSYEIYTRSAASPIAATTRSEFAGYDDPAYQWTCAAWQVPKAPQAMFTPAHSDAPTLVVEQRLDPRWDPASEQQLRAGLSHLDVLSFASLPGGALPGDFPACYGDVRRAFVRDPNHPLDTDACGAQTPRIDFVVPTH
jgi:class 3 adenylate cyclase/pimeloyl-ACP methyl ester carboxylesterase